ncbi:MAG: monovalent cation:proton antiporter-2 (CPA2) family protein [Halioglobus sp.]|jgi:CPA2 family monovalent cation:H+ antiporter-2
MEDNHAMLNVLFYLAAGVIAVPLFRKLGLGAILGYLAAGVVLGPSVTGAVSDPLHVLHFAEFGVIMLLFLIGLELAPDKLWRMRGQIGLTGGSQLFFSAGLISLVLLLFSVPTTTAIILGLTLGLSSTAFAIQLMAEQKVLASPLGRKGFSILLLQDLAVIPLLLLVEFLAPVASGNSAQALPWWLGVLAVIGVLVAGRFLINPLLKVIATSGSRETMTAAALLIVLSVALLMQAVGLSMGLGAFVAGIVLANSSFRHQLETDIEPFKGLLLGLFFIAVGMTMNLQLLLEQPLMLLGFAVLLIAIKTLVIAVIVTLQKTTGKQSVQLGLMLSQGGEFAFVVVALAGTLGLMDQGLSEQVVLVVGLSMALTSPLLSLQQRFWPNPAEDNRDYDTERDEAEPEVIIAGFGRFGQIVGRLLTASGVPFTALDKDATHIDVIKRFGNRIFFGDATRMDLLKSAGIEHARLLVIAVDDSEEALAIAAMAKESCPNLKIVARAHNRMHAYQLIALGADDVLRETFGSSLEAASLSLIHLGFTEGQALERMQIFRQHDEERVVEAATHKDDVEKLLLLAHEGKEELERLFNQDGVV